MKFGERDLGLCASSQLLGGPFSCRVLRLIHVHGKLSVFILSVRAAERVGSTGDLKIDIHPTGRRRVRDHRGQDTEIDVPPDPRIEFTARGVQRAREFELTCRR